MLGEGRPHPTLPMQTNDPQHRMPHINEPPSIAQQDIPVPKLQTTPLDTPPSSVVHLYPSARNRPSKPTPNARNIAASIRVLRRLLLDAATENHSRRTNLRTESHMASVNQKLGPTGESHNPAHVETGARRQQQMFKVKCNQNRVTRELVLQCPVAERLCRPRLASQPESLRYEEFRHQGLDDRSLYPTTSFRIGLRSGHSVNAGQEPRDTRLADQSREGRWHGDIGGAGNPVVQLATHHRYPSGHAAMLRKQPPTFIT